MTAVAQWRTREETAPRASGKRPAAIVDPWGRRRFPAEWLEAEPPVMGQVRATSLVGEAPATAPAPQRVRRVQPLLWMMLGVMVVGLGIALYAMVAEYAGPGGAGVTHRVLVEGVITDLRTEPGGMTTLTVVTPAGRPATAVYEGGRMSVFQQHGVLGVSHLKPGQEVCLMEEAGVARCIEILHQPGPGLRY